MKLRLDEYYSIINEEWEDIESYMPEDMAEEFEKFRESHTQDETYRIVDMYRKNKPINGIHYDSWGNPILAYRVDKRHSLFFGLIHYWDYGAYNLCPEYLFSSIDKAKEQESPPNNDGNPNNPDPSP